MSSYLNINTWLWDGRDNAMVIDVSKSGSDKAYIKLELGHNSVSFTLTREDAKKLKDKIENFLIDN